MMGKMFIIHLYDVVVSSYKSYRLSCVAYDRLI